MTFIFVNFAITLFYNFISFIYFIIIIIIFFWGGGGGEGPLSSQASWN